MISYIYIIHTNLFYIFPSFFKTNVDVQEEQEILNFQVFTKEQNYPLNIFKPKSKYHCPTKPQVQPSS